MKKYLPFVIALMLIGVTTFAQNTTKKSYTGVKRIRILTSSGDCEIRKSSGATVEVELSHTFDEKFFVPRFEQSGERLTLGEEFNGRNFTGSVRWKIYVPDGVRIDFKTGSGNLIVDGVNVDMDAWTGSGDLEFASVKGNVQAGTGSGNVDLSNFNGEARMNTGSGDLRVNGAEGDLDLNCGSGDIKLFEASAYFVVNTGSGNISAEKIKITGSSRFNTGSGRAKVTLTATPAYDLSVNSGSGNAELNFNGNEILGEVVMKANKRWGHITAPFEFDKTEEIEQGGNGNDNVMVVKTAQRGKATNRISVGTGSGDAVLRK